MEYPDGCNTTIRHVARKIGLYDLEMISLWGCNFQTGGFAYDNKLSCARKLQIRAIHTYVGYTKVITNN